MLKILLLTVFLMRPEAAISEQECFERRSQLQQRLHLSSCMSPLIRLSEIQDKHRKGLTAFRDEMETSFSAFLPRDGISPGEALDSAKKVLSFAKDALKGAPGFMDSQILALREFIVSSESDLSKIQTFNQKLSLQKNENKASDDGRFISTFIDEFESAVRLGKGSMDRWLELHECYRSALLFLRKRIRLIQEKPPGSTKEIEEFLNKSRPLKNPPRKCQI